MQINGSNHGRTTKSELRLTALTASMGEIKLVEPRNGVKIANDSLRNRDDQRNKTEFTIRKRRTNGTCFEINVRDARPGDLTTVVGLEAVGSDVQDKEVHSAFDFVTISLNSSCERS